MLGICGLSVLGCILLFKNTGYLAAILYPLILLITSILAPLIFKKAGLFYNTLFVSSLYYVQYFLLTSIGYDQTEFSILVVAPLLISLVTTVAFNCRRTRNQLG